MAIPGEDDNPFAPPAAAVLEPAAQGAGGFVADGRKVASSRGFAWIGEAWRLFTRAPLRWILMFVAFFLASIVLAIVPLGPLVTAACYPVVTGGLMLGCRELERGGALSYSHLFAGFSRNAGSLFVVGLLYLAGAMLIGFLAGFGMALALPAFATSGKAGSFFAFLPVFAAVVLAVVALTLPLFMALWFAPAIVVFQDAQPMAAMRSSFRGAMRNFMPFLAYGVALLGLGLVALLTFGLAFLVVGPLVWITMFTGYRDLFEGGA